MMIAAFVLGERGNARGDERSEGRKTEVSK